MTIRWASTIRKSRTIATTPNFHWEYRSSGSAPWTAGSFSYSKQETIHTFCHTGWWAGAAGTKGDVGGEMRLVRNGTVDVSVASGDNLRGINRFRGDLGISALVGHSHSFVSGTSGKGPLQAYGTRAVAEVLPADPNASLAQLLAELKREGLPSIPGASFKDRVFEAKKAGHEYLNIEFGWLPLVADLEDLAKSVIRSKRLIAQYVRDSDRKVRRRHSAPRLHESANFSGSPVWSPSYNQVTAPGATCSETRWTQFSFSGAFRYHVPVDDGFIDRLHRYEQFANFLLGTRITPELVWELAPWSWLVDWFSNFGDVLHNISNLGSDGQVMQYGYAMRHQQTQSVLAATIASVGSNGTFAGQRVHRTIISETKQRMRANPYGFGIDDLSLSNRQLAILAALGLTRARRDPDNVVPYP